MTQGQAFSPSSYLPCLPRPGRCNPHEKDALVGRVAEIRRETGVLSRDFARGGSAICIRGGGEGEIPRANALAGEIYGLPSCVLLSDVQSLPSSIGGSAHGGERAFG